MLVYDDFSIEISATPTGYIIRGQTPAGRAQAEAYLPLSALELENRLQAVELSLLRGRGGLRRAVGENERQAQELGQIFFDFLFSHDVRALFDLSRRQAEQQERGLRLVLTVEPPELARLPWEFLYHNREGEFLALSQSTPVVRYWAAPYAQQTLTVTPPLRVLGIVASPTDWEALDVAQEKARLENALAPLQQAGLAELVWMEGQDRRDLQSAMRAGPWHCIHFIGHGGFDSERDEGFIVLCDQAGKAARLYAGELARLVADHHSLRLVFLNACEGAAAPQGDDLASSAAALVRRSVPAVVAMQYPISDGAAIEFSRTFYEALADNLPVDAAVTDARKAVSLAIPHSPEWATPVLFLAAQDGRLFSLEKAVDGASTPGTSLPPVDPSPAKSSISGYTRYLWLLLLLIIFAFVLWQNWPWPSTNSAPTPVPTLSPGAALPPTQAAPGNTPAPMSTFPLPVADHQTLLQLTFDTPESIRRPLWGPGGSISVPKDQFVPGRNGNGLRFGVEPGIVAFPVRSGDQRAIDLNRGEMEFWYQPAYDHDPTDEEPHALIVVGDLSSGVQLSLSVVGRLTFSITDHDSVNLYVRTSLAHSLWKAGEWVHMRAAWDATLTDDPIQLYVNDERVDTDRSLHVWQVDDSDLPNLLLVGVGDQYGVLPADGIIDDLTIRAVPNGSATDAPAHSTPEPGALLQTTFEDAASIRSPVTGPGGVTTLPSIVFVPGQEGNGLRFGEERGVVAFPLAAAASRPIDFAQGEIEFWYQPAYDHDPVSDTAHALINAGDWYADTQLRLAVVGRLTFSIFNDNPTSFGVRSSLTRPFWKAGEWVHIRAVWDAAQADDPIQLYVNDERVDTDRNLRAWKVDDADLPETLYVGGASNDGMLPADGVIDELIIRSTPPSR